MAPHSPKGRPQVALRKHLSRSRNHVLLGSLPSSRVSLRSVHTDCSTHHQRWRMAAACGGKVAPATAAARFLSSFVIDFTPPLPCVPWLRGRYPLPRYSGRSDSRRAAPRASIGHEHRSGPSGSPCLAPLHVPPFRLQPPRRPSPSLFRSAGFSRFGRAGRSALGVELGKGTC